MAEKFNNPLYPVLQDYQQINKTIFFSLVCIITILLLLLKKNFIESEIAAFEILEERGEMGFYHMVNALQYASVPLVYLYKFTVTAFVLWVGCFTFGYKVSYRNIWHLVMIAECVFFIAEAVKIGWFLTIHGDPEIWDIRAFYPLSLINFFSYREIAEFWHYPLKALNLFEIIYWCILALGIQYYSRKKISVSVYIVLSFYVFWFILWLAFYMIVYK